MKVRKMFNTDIVRSKKFISMPLETQLLYFQLGMETDDNKFVSKDFVKNKQDLELLIKNNFVKESNNGLIVEDIMTLYDED